MYNAFSRTAVKLLFFVEKAIMPVQRAPPFPLNSKVTWSFLNFASLTLHVLSVGSMC